MTREQAQELFVLLQKHYPHAHMILEWSNNFELLVSIILSAQCTDKKVNEVTSRVFPKYKKERPELKDTYHEWISLLLSTEKTLLKNDISAEEIIELVNFAYVPLSELEQDIKSTGFYKAKANNVQKAAHSVLEVFHGVLPRTIAELTTLPGVGRKTANVFLTNAYHIDEGIAVDTHVTKQAQALGFTTQSDPLKIEQDLMALFPSHQWHDLTYLLIEHGRNLRLAKTKQNTCLDPTCILTV